MPTMQKKEKFAATTYTHRHKFSGCPFSWCKHLHAYIKDRAWRMKWKTINATWNEKRGMIIMAQFYRLFFYT